MAIALGTQTRVVLGLRTCSTDCGTALNVCARYVGERLSGRIYEPIDATSRPIASVHQRLCDATVPSRHLNPIGPICGFGDMVTKERFAVTNQTRKRLWDQDRAAL